MAQGNWYELVEDGAGNLAGSDLVIGSGTFDYPTKTINVTLGALPDADSAIIITYGTPTHYSVLSGATANNEAASMHLRHKLANVPVVSTSLSLTFMRNSTPVVVNAGSNGTISGDGITGWWKPLTGDVYLEFTTTPDNGSQVQFDYVQQTDDLGGAAQDTYSFVSSQASYFIKANMVPGELAGTISLAAANGGLFSILPGSTGNLIVPVYDDGAGHLKIESGIVMRGPQTGAEQDLSNTVVGTIDYVAGTITPASFSGIADKYTAYSGSLDGFTFGSYASLATTIAWRVGFSYQARFVSTASALLPGTGKQDSIDLATYGIAFDLTDLYSHYVVPNSVEFEMFSKVHRDYGDGIVYTNIDPNTGAGTAVGTIDYESGAVKLTAWTANSAIATTVTSLLGQLGQWSSNYAYFRTAAAPIKPESLQLVLEKTNGEQLLVTADANGNFTHADITGTVDYSTGIVQFTLGNLVPYTSLTPAELLLPWAVPANVDGDGNILRPIDVYPNSSKYNAVSYTYLPLNADILGVDAVRLPADGRVPIFRDGTVVNIMHPVTMAPQTVVSSEPVNLGRTRIGWVRVTDANGATVDAYTLDYDNGIVTFGDVTGIPMPVTIKHTVADLRVVTDTQITGHISLSQPLTHDYPADETIVSACVIHGDRKARVSLVWDLLSWNGIYTDDTGTPAVAELNLIDYPIVVTNEGTDTDRWAIKWLTSTSVQVWSEKRGLVWSGIFDVGGTDIAPINPRTKTWDANLQQWIGGTPYFVIPNEANGGGWAAGNTLRLNTVGAISDVWVARAINQSEAPLGDGEDGCEIYALGNIDRP
jgi:hypothetical protein